jgi:hypothetical protein
LPPQPFNKRITPASLRALSYPQRIRVKHALGLDPEVRTGVDKENASEQTSKASILIRSEQNGAFGAKTR